MYANNNATDVFFIIISRINSFNVKTSNMINIMIKLKPILIYGMGRGNIFSSDVINDERKAKNIMS